MITETMGVEQVDMRYTQPEAAPTLPRTTGELELDNLPAIETSTARVDGQDFASNLVKQNESGADETRLNMEKKLLWEGIRWQLKLEKETVEQSKRWDYGKERDFDKLLSETAVQLQIASGEKIDMH